MGHSGFDSLLDTLKKSVLFSADFPRRLRRSHADYAGLGEEDQARAHEPGLIAIRQVTNSRDLAQAVKQLGTAKQAAAVPLLAELWADSFRGVGGPQVRH